MLDTRSSEIINQMSYKKLLIWELAQEIVVIVHKMTLENLPKYEMFEEGAQIRRSSKSVKSNIVEGYGRRRYKKEFIRFLVFSISSNDETTDHLETLWLTKSLQNEALYIELAEKLDNLGRKLNLFIQSVERQHLTSARN